MYDYYEYHWQCGVQEQTPGLTVSTLFAMHAIGVCFLPHALGLQSDYMVVLQAPVVEASNPTHLPNDPTLWDCQSLLVSL